MNRVNKKVMVFGTFDIFHEGHRNFLKQAKKFGDFLYVLIARDQTVLEVKKTPPLNLESQRLLAIKDSGLADKVILGNLRDKYRAIKKYQPDIICLGYDQNSFNNCLKEKLLELNLGTTKIIRLKPFKPNIYKTSKLKKLLF
ncbi:MAG: adenylyltransferase/cytidyltransferase family protein [Planctomycetes bacterium]|nr:adenylyltransferase/cytidyltransferase family protein [Planctomycetota bacterium]